MTALPKVKLRIELNISTCGQCPYRQLIDTDHQTYDYEVFCRKKEHVVGMINYNEFIKHKTPAIPDWCPFRIKSSDCTTTTKQSNSRFIQILEDIK